MNTAEGSKREAPSGAYTQINFLFPPSAVDLPSADKFKEFPPEAQQAILAAFRIEQTHRHQWVTNQQGNDHALNMLRQKHAFLIRVFGLGAALAIVVASLGFAAWLIQMGQTIFGVAVLLASVGALIGTAIYGHKARSVPQPEAPTAQPAPAAEIEKI